VLKALLNYNFLTNKKKKEKIEFRSFFQYREFDLSALLIPIGVKVLNVYTEREYTARL